MQAEPHMTDEHQSNEIKNIRRIQLTKTITFNLAAGIIADSNFPTKDHIPAIAPLPFTNFGHQALIDHKLLQSIIWTTILRMQEASKKWRTKLWIYTVVSFGAALAGFGMADSTFWKFASPISLLVIGGIIIFFEAGAVRKRLADIKATELNKLLSGDWVTAQDKGFQTYLHNKMKHFGSGELDGNSIPVLVVTRDNDPFPGYGRLQLENSFVCRPKSTANNRPELDIEKINEIVFGNVNSAIAKAGIPDVTSGIVVTVYGDSITMDSKWLDEDKSPILWIPRNKLADFIKIEDSASSRHYFAIQIVFPEHINTSTFFFRMFLAGNAACCHLAVSTIGPPILDKHHVRKALLRHKLTKSPEKKSRPENQKKATFEAKINPLLIAIKNISKFTEDGVDFINPALDLLDLGALKFNDTELSGNQKKEYEEEFNKIVQQSTMWPGAFGFKNTNIRDINSYTFSKDFYGRPEIQSCIRTMYDQISRSILDSFDELGFDISNYRSKDGHYSINAEKIDSLVIGEAIHIRNEKPAAATPASAATNKT